MVSAKIGALSCLQCRLAGLEVIVIQWVFIGSEQLLMGIMCEATRSTGPPCV